MDDQPAVSSAVSRKLCMRCRADGPARRSLGYLGYQASVSLRLAPARQPAAGLGRPRPVPASFLACSVRCREGCGPVGPQSDGIVAPFACLVCSLSSFVRLFVPSFVCLFVCSFVRLFVRLFVCLFVCSFVCLACCLLALWQRTCGHVSQSHKSFAAARCTSEFAAL